MFLFFREKPTDLRPCPDAADEPEKWGDCCLVAFPTGGTDFKIRNQNSEFINKKYDSACDWGVSGGEATVQV